jgi:predicted Zn-dependent protease
VHDGGAQLQVEVGLDALLRHRLGHALRVAALKLPAVSWMNQGPML